jgi:Flp pilus assembly protein TadG
VLAADRRGNLMIEFALALPILFLLLVGLLDLGRFGLQKSAMLQGAREGAQYGIIAPPNRANINTTAQNATGLTGVTATNNVFCECSSAPVHGPWRAPTTCSGGATLKNTSPSRRPATSARCEVGQHRLRSFGSWTPPTTASARDVHRALTCGAGTAWAPTSGAARSWNSRSWRRCCFTLLLGIVEMGRMFYVRQALEYATEEAARYYMLNPTDASSQRHDALAQCHGGGHGTQRLGRLRRHDELQRQPVR